MPHAQRQKAHETLIKIATFSNELHTKLARSSADLETVSVRTRLNKIIVASQSILEKSLGNTDDTALDPRLEDWLCGKEPDMCFHILSDMDRAIGTGPGGSTLWDRVNSMRYNEGKIIGAIKLFNDRQNFFHFLLTPEVWNCETGATNDRSQLAMAGGVVRRVAYRASREEPKNESPDPEKLDSVLQWLDGLNCDAKHGDSVSLRQPDTCAWLPDTNHYKVWRNRDDSFLWLQGKPGAGKTVLTASVIEGIKKTLQEGECIVFFYCDFRDERTTKAVAVMRSILSQLLRKLRNGAGQDLVQLVNDMINEQSDGTSVLKQARRIAPYVSRAARQFSRQPFVIIDALDECRDVEDLLQTLCKLANDGMHLFVTSRPLLVIKDNFDGLPSISMDRMAKEVSADIKLHVTREVDGDRQLRSLEGSLKKEILTTLQDKADGMFRWVQCQIDALRKCITAKKIRSTLLSLPNGLDETYERILRAIDPESSKEAHRALDWLVAALRPLRLVEILEALSIDLQRRRLDREIAPVHGHALLDALGSLVVYDEESDIIKLSHFSVKEYIVGIPKRTDLSMYRADIQMAHAQIALLCMCYIAAVVKYRARFQTETSLQAPSHQQTEVTPILSKSHPLLHYALHDGFRHLQFVGSENHVVIDGIIALRSDIKQHPGGWQLICELTTGTLPWPFPSGQYPGAQHDFIMCTLISLLPEQFLRAFLCRAPFKAFDGTNPLIYATYFDKIEHARTLLSCGISHVNTTGLDVTNPRHQVLPLKLAFRCRHHSLFDLFLLDREVTVPLSLFSYVFYKKHLDFNTRDATKLLQLDEFAEWVSDGQRGPLLRALCNDWPLVVLSASKKDIIAILRRLAQVGCGPDSLEFVLGITLNAVSKGSLSMLLDLCSLGVPIPSRAFSVGTFREALWRKPIETGAELIKKLALHSLDMNTIMAHGNTALYRAFGECKHGSSCWALNCNPCSIFLRAITLRDYIPEPIDVLFVGRKGVGKCSLINMTLGILDDSPGAAQVTDRSDPRTTCYATLLESLPVQIWDTPGFDRMLDDRYLQSQVNEWLLSVSSSHDSKTNCSAVQVICCMNAGEISDPVAWRQFQAVHEECHRLGATSMVLVNKPPTNSPDDLEAQCKDQLKRLGVSADLVLLKGVQSHQGVSSREYESDSSAIRLFIEERANHLGNQSQLPLLAMYSARELQRCGWVTIHPETGPNVCNQIVHRDYICDHLTQRHGLSHSSKVPCHWEGCNFERDMDRDQVIRHVRSEHLPELFGSITRWLHALFKRH